MKIERMGTEKPVHGAENFEVSAGAKAILKEERIQIKKEDLKVPENFDKGEALIIPIINIKDIRDEKDGEIGSLYSQQVLDFQMRIESFIDKIYEKIPEGERQDTEIVVLAGENDLITPVDGFGSAHQRAVETGEVVISAIVKSMKEKGIEPKEALTTNKGKTVATNLLNDLELMHPITEEKAGANKKYLEFLKNKYGTGRELWVAFEEDAEREMRQSFGADGPDDIANDMNNALQICSRIAETHQEENPDKRVVVFAIGFYDNLSPWVKKYLLKSDPAKKFVPVEKGSGLVIKKTPAGVASTTIGEKSFSVEI
jgi:hypothetical protein